MRKIRRFLCSLLSALLAFTPPLAYPAFDPVNDDTDIFLANPNITSNNPNILILLDNTANWNQPFVNEKNALSSVIDSLKDNFNVGLMLFPETGAPNDNTDGGYVRFAVRQMKGDPQRKLSDLIFNFHILNDKGNNATHGLGLYEAYLYYAGLRARSGDGKFKTDHDRTTLDAQGLGKHAIGGSDGPPPLPITDGVYRTPIVDGCQKNYVLLVSNGPANENAAARAELEGYLAGLTKATPPDVIQITGTDPFTGTPADPSQQTNWADEMARYMANNDVLPDDQAAGREFTIGTQNVFTYVIEVNPVATGQGPGMTSLLQSTALNGKGKYWGVTDDASGTKLRDAFEQFFKEVQAVNSVFASTTLPVSINVRGTNLNQVYIGVFRPDEKKQPRWLGNLKMYQLALAGDEVILADADGNPAVNQQTGFIDGAAKSFWTSTSTFWGFKNTDPANPFGQGGASDSPDGDLVEKGGAAQRVRVVYPNAENPVAPETKRSLYTYTNSGFASNCTTNCALSNTPFRGDNTDITNGSLQLDTKLVDPLTAFETKSVATLTDRRTATLNNTAAGALPVTLSNGATTRTITNLTTATPKAVQSLSGEGPGTITVNLTSVAKTAGRWLVTLQSALTGVIVGTTVLGINCTAGDTTAINNLTATQRTVKAQDSSTVYEINGPASGNPSCTAGTVDGPGLVATSNITVNLTSHGFGDGAQVTIANAVTSPDDANGVFTITVPLVSGSPDPDRFTYSLPGGKKAGVAAAAPGQMITATGNTTTATATTSGVHGFANGSTVTISGASIDGYNRANVAISCSPAATCDGLTTFSYPVLSALPPNPIPSPSNVFAVQGGSTVVTVTALTAHGFSVGDTVTIGGSDISGYNGTWKISTVAGDGLGFTYDTAVDNVAPTAAVTQVLPASTGSVTVSGSTSATVRVTAANHGFTLVAPPINDQVVVERTDGASDGLTSADATPWTVTNVIDANTFEYSTGTAQSGPSGSYTVRPPASIARAIAAVTGHGYAVSDLVTINGAAKAAYNGADKTVTRIVDANTFEYALTSAPGPDTSTAITSSKKTSTARATSVGHNLSTGNLVTITGATPSTFNVANASITVIDANTFTYSIAPAVEGNASGAIRAAASGSTGAQRTSLINWVRGEDNFENENKNGSTTDIRASVHGDVLHSRPAVINYNRFGSDNDVVIYYGGNDGIFHAVKGGTGSDAGQPAAGNELWGFVPQEFFGQFGRMRTNSPVISSSFKKPYFMDGPIGVYTKDGDDNGMLGDGGDIVNLYIANRRGGRFLYALDVNIPTNPKFKWKIDTATTGFSELGQTWSQPTVVPEGFAGYPKPVLIFGAGYDPAVEDIPPSITLNGVTTEITSINTTTGAITITGGTVIDRSMGRGIYVVDAETGALVWSAGGSQSNGTFTLDNVPGMIYAIPSDVTVIKNETGQAINRAYVGDTGGQLWRIDFKSDNPADPSVQNLNGTTVTKIASIADPANPLTGQRKFLHAPDVVGFTGFDAVLLGSGDREHPFDTGVQNRFYMFKDKGDDFNPFTGTTYGPSGTLPVLEPTIVEADMFDATSNCVANPDQCIGGPDADPASAQTSLGNAKGWYIRLIGDPTNPGGGEKVVGNAVTVSGHTFFNTNQPKGAAQVTPGVCVSDLGIARAYIVNTADAQPVVSNALTGKPGDRFQEVGEGGYLPSPVHVVVMLGGKPVEVVISGVKVSTPKGATLSARLRKYWYKEVD
ncbi:MAG: hypothetical protein HY526_12030 [Betaproteobacteria bacterium]|nr:hypothetical protein [Betaproteobacteria bacterium]